MPRGKETAESSVWQVSRIWSWASRDTHKTCERAIRVHYWHQNNDQYS